MPDVAGSLATIRDRVEIMLQDATNARWAAGDVDEAITQALQRYSQVAPYRKITTVTLGAADAREIDISAITDYLSVERVWWDYDDTDPAHPPHWRNFEVWPGDILYINDPHEPDTADVVRIWYTALHTLDTTVASGTDGVANGTSTFTSAAGAFVATMIGDDIDITARGVYGIAAVGALNSVTLFDQNTLGWPAAGAGLTYAVYDRATASTVPVDHETLLVTGAAGIAALSRSVELNETLSIDGWVPKRLRIWGDERSAEFQTGLDQIAAGQAARASGIAPGPLLDRWDDGSGWW